jgi:uncharacterized OsmC-like protein
MEGDLMTKIINSTAKLLEEFRISVDNGRFHCVCLDLPPELGTDKGPTALELGVMSFAGCISQIFYLMSKKMRVSVSALEVNVKAEKPDDAKTVTKADIEIKVTTSESEDKINRVWQHTRDNCPVGQLFEGAGIPVNYNLKIIKK